MFEFHLIVTVVGAVVLGIGLISKLLRSRGALSMPMLAMAVGMLLGPHALDLLNPQRWRDMAVIVEQATSLTLAIALMSIALRLPPGFIFNQRRAFLLLLAVVMPAMWLVSSLLSYWLSGLPLALCFLLGAMVTPTDPIVASAIATGEFAEKNLPERLRHMLSGESGANDGLGYLFLMAPLALLLQPEQGSLRLWGGVLLVDVLGGALLGVLIGLAAGKLLVWGERKRTFERVSFLSYTIALALLTIGAAGLLEVDGILAVFVAGIAFDHLVGGQERAQEANIQETVNQFFTLPIFTLFGLMAPIDAWLQLGWQAWLLALLVLLSRRLPVILLLRPLFPTMRSAADALFFGWFGPIGISALFYATLALQHDIDSRIWHLASLMIFASIVVHGATAVAFTKAYARQMRS